MSRAPVVLVLVDLVQDFDVLEPVLLALRAERRLGVRVCVSKWLLHEAPRAPEALRRLRLSFDVVRRTAIKAGQAPALRGVAAVLLASESAAPPHVAGHVLARRADAAGVATYALQHGVELGEPGAPPPAMASRVLFCWGRAGAEQAAGTGPEPVIVGRAATPVGEPKFDLGVFENLHWDRYAEAERTRVLDRLTATAHAFRDLRLLVRSHPAGGWMDRAADDLAGLSNVHVQTSAQSRAEPGSGLAAAAACARVITTPSTVALDAAAAGRRVALALDGGDAYRPLPVLGSEADWIAFARGPSEPTPDEAAFLRRHVEPGDAAVAMVARLINDLSRH